MSQGDKTHPSFLLRLRDRADELSWPEFHERYGHMLYRYARGRGATHEDAEDVVQEVEMQVFKAIGGFEYDARKGRFRTYLRAAVVHALGRRAQREARQPQGLDPRTLDYVAEEAEARTDDAWEQEWCLHRLRWAMRAIASEFDPTLLKAFEMHVLAGRPITEVAEQLGVSKWRVYRARDRILKRLEEELLTLDAEGDA